MAMSIMTDDERQRDVQLSIEAAVGAARMLAPMIQALDAAEKADEIDGRLRMKLRQNVEWLHRYCEMFTEKFGALAS